MLIQYFQPSINVPFDRQVFRNASQRDDETIEQFIMRLRQNAETCEFTKVEEHIRDQIIEKCNSNVLRQKFLEKGKELNLEMLRKIARSYETAVAQIKNFGKPEEVKQEERENVNRLLKKSSAGRFANFNKPKSYNQEKCFRCGKTGHRAKNLNCPARNRECFKSAWSNYGSAGRGTILHKSCRSQAATTLYNKAWRADGRESRVETDSK